MSRRRTQERRQRERCGTLVEAAVPCSHGTGEQHLVRLVMDKANRVLQVSTPCESLGETDRRVLEGLVGDEYRCCTFAKEVVCKVLASSRDFRARSTADVLPITLRAALNIAREQAALVAGTRSAPMTPSVQREAQRLRTLVEGLFEGLVLPHGWSARMRMRRAARDVQGREVNRLLLSVCVGKNNAYRDVARYAARGKWVTNHVAFAEACTMRPENDLHRGTRVCGACGTRLKSLTQHVRSKKHKENTEREILRIMEHVSARLKRKDWKSCSPSTPS